MNRYLVIGHILNKGLEHDYIHARTPEQASEYFENKVKIRQLCDGHSLPSVLVDYVISGEEVKINLGR